MPSQFAVYELATGRIIRQGSASTRADAAIQSMDCTDVCDVVIRETTDDKPFEDDLSGDRLYVIDGALTQRPALDLAEAYTLAKGDTLSLTLPAGAVVSVEGVGSETVADGSFAFEGDVPDTYRATVSLWPYLDKALTITVTEATP